MASSPSNGRDVQHVSQALESVIIDGLQAVRIVSPRSAEEAARVLDEARVSEMKVAPIGGMTALALGNVPTRIDFALSTRLLSGVLAYEPTDLTLSVWAGTPMAHVQDTLAERGQTLPVDVPRIADATVGGVIATNLFGPRRSGAPTFRDLLIGISAVHPNGALTKAGGMVVKNVSGFDLMRVYLGSLGTLGVIVSANFKVLPKARHEATVVARFDHLEDALAAADRVQQSRVLASSLELYLDQQTWSVSVRIEGRASTVKLLQDDAAQLLRADTLTIEGNESADWWRIFIDAEEVEAGPAEMFLRASVRPRVMPQSARQFLDVIDEHGASVRQLSITPRLGQVTAKLSLRSGDDDGQQFVNLHASLARVVDNLLVLAAPPERKTSIDVWGRMPETIDVMRSLKEEFDPSSVLNPGRFVGRI